MCFPSGAHLSIIDSPHGLLDQLLFKQEAFLGDLSNLQQAFPFFTPKFPVKHKKRLHIKYFCSLERLKMFSWTIKIFSLASVLTNGTTVVLVGGVTAV